MIFLIPTKQTNKTMETTKAKLWVMLREVFLDLLQSDVYNYESLPEDAPLAYNKLCEAIKACAPSMVFGPPNGDSGWISFDDGSRVDWDWDNGDFEHDGVRFTYPWAESGLDPLFWDKSIFRQ